MRDHLRVRAVMAEHGGAASSSVLRAAVGHRDLDAAVADAVITRVARGRYVTPSLLEHRQAAFAISAVASHESAAACYGWSAKSVPRRPHLTVRRNRHLTVSQRRAVVLSWKPLDRTEVVDGVTAPLRTVVDCALDLPFDEALAIADSALRCGDVTREELAGVTVTGRGCRAARRVLALADARAANPLESVLRAIAQDVPDLRVQPQVELTGADWYARVDLADRGLGLVLEAEGFETHGRRAGFDKDCERYVNLVCAGFAVLRFTWTQVMYRPEWVEARIREMTDRLTDRWANREDPPQSVTAGSAWIRAS